MKLNNSIFGRVVKDALKAAGGKAFAASEKGKLLSSIGGGLPTAGEIGDNLFITEEDGILYLECYIITSFGASIRSATQAMLDYMETELKQMFPGDGGRLRIKVVGVRSRQIAERNIEVERQWEKAEA